ncbi:hypothetical protein [Rhodocista pekingensis]|uniref:Antifreeze glycopeptide polyprotein n=1 Tax=Rhodocista pekingensis TaxID=201185 RepID=A0ABW2KRR1_9PROT
MNASAAEPPAPRARRLAALLLAGAVALPATAMAQVPASRPATPPPGGPMRLGPPQGDGFFRPDLPEPGPEVSVGRAPAGIEVETLGTLSADGGGALDPASGGLPADLWAATPRATVERLLAGLPDRLASGAARDLARRLLLSRAVPPRGEGGPRGLTALRLEALARTGDAAAAAALADAAPAALEDEDAARAWMLTQLLAGDAAAADAACAKAPDLLARFRHPEWQKVQIACQVRAGQAGGVTLGIDLLREQGEKDDLFFRLAEGAAAGTKAPVKGIAQPTLPQLALIRAAGRGFAGEVTVDSPAALAAVAQATDTPVPVRLAAAERAAALGALSGRDLAQVYRAVKVTPEELKDPVSAAGKRKGAEARALLIRALEGEPAPADRPGLLARAAAAGDVTLLSGGYGELLMQQVALLPPTAAAQAAAPAAARLALVQGRPDLARPWVDLVRADAASGRPAARAAWALLWPLAAVNGLSAPGEMDLAGWLDLFRVEEDATARRQAGAVLTLLVASGVAVDPAQRLRTLTAPGDAAERGVLPDPTLWYRLEAAAAERRPGEAALLALHLLGTDGPAGVPPLVATHAALHLSGAGLGEAGRRVATEAAAALLGP